MALIHLLTSKLDEECIEHAVHPEATHFNCKSGEIRQHRINPDIPPTCMKIIPEGANTFIVEGYRRRGERLIDYGKIKFFSYRGNVLKEYEL